MDKLERARKLKGIQVLYQDDDSLTTMDIIEHVNNQEDNISKPGMGQESSTTQDYQNLAAQDSNASSPYLTNRNEIEHRTRDNTKVERMFTALADNTKLKMKQQEERHAKEIADMRQSNRDTHELFTTKTTTPQNITMNDHRITAHFNKMTRTSYTICPCTLTNGATPRTHGDPKELQTRQDHGELRHQY
jgi:hypothetical protein